MNCGNNCEALLRRVYETSFAVDDVVLYLDTHPADQDALNYYCYVSDLRRQAVEAYEAQCGPLLNDRVTCDNYWQWVCDPWPWEGECG